MKRTLPGVLLAACWLALLLKGSFYLFWLVLCGVVCVGCREYLNMVLQTPLASLQYLFLSVILLFPVFCSILGSTEAVVAGLIASFLLLASFILWNYARLEDGYSLFVKASFGLLYIGFLLPHLVLIFALEDGGKYLLVLTAITAGSDTGAYYSGKFFGKHKLCPNVSPNKTIEGAVGGLAVAIIIAALFSWWLFGSVNWLSFLPTVVLLTGIGIMGDLTESVIKRGTGTKDSGTLLAGHGGVLDRLDSMIFAGPVLYYLLLFTGGG